MQENYINFKKFSSPNDIFSTDDFSHAGQNYYDTYIYIIPMIDLLFPSSLHFPVVHFPHLYTTIMAT